MTPGQIQFFVEFGSPGDFDLRILYRLAKSTFNSDFSFISSSQPSKSCCDYTAHPQILWPALTWRLTTLTIIHSMAGQHNTVDMSRLILEPDLHIFYCSYYSLTALFLYVNMPAQPAPRQQQQQGARKPPFADWPTIKILTPPQGISFSILRVM